MTDRGASPLPCHRPLLSLPRPIKRALDLSVLPFRPPRPRSLHALTRTTPSPARAWARRRSAAPLLLLDDLMPPELRSGVWISSDLFPLSLSRSPRPTIAHRSSRVAPRRRAPSPLPDSPCRLPHRLRRLPRNLVHQATAKTIVGRPRSADISEGRRRVRLPRVSCAASRASSPARSQPSQQPLLPSRAPELPAPPVEPLYPPLCRQITIRRIGSFST
ncbi:hypothetical protein C2845_PM03G30960 [Panicum miliaceum]|uniref:Uncharacterized protein n=1 Tax=Panicum miliaceum TaxID=4540 RepID=A0A3L6T8B0_PANMI|nr:hypothetical protein C2845_PM03G30960 [Panicum miliaceum]